MEEHGIGVVTCVEKVWEWTSFKGGQTKKTYNILESIYKDPGDIFCNQVYLSTNFYKVIMDGYDQAVKENADILILERSLSINSLQAYNKNLNPFFCCPIFSRRRC